MTFSWKQTGPTREYVSSSFGTEQAATEKYECTSVAVILRREGEQVYRLRAWKDFGNYVSEHATLDEAKFAAELIFDERNTE